MPLSPEDRKEVKLIALDEIKNISLAVTTHIEKNQPSTAVKEQANILFQIVNKACSERHAEVFTKPAEE